MDRYCDICEKMVKSYYIINIKGVKHFKGECGHTSAVREEKPKGSPGIRIGCAGMGAGGNNRV
jgi:hypothetical protein